MTTIERHTDTDIDRFDIVLNGRKIAVLAVDEEGSEIEIVLFVPQAEAKQINQRYLDDGDNREVVVTVQLRGDA